jgi:hypothetical protein
MALSTLGMIAPPTPDGAETAIDEMRHLIPIYDDPTTKDIVESSDYSTGLGMGQLETGLAAAGAYTDGLEVSLDSIDAAIARGNPVIVGSSTTYDAWGSAQNTADPNRTEFPTDNYLNGVDPGGHFVTVLGKTDSGNYIVGDPMIKSGTMEVTPENMQTILDRSFPCGILEVSAKPFP